MTAGAKVQWMKSKGFKIKGVPDVFGKDQNSRQWMFKN
jgi:hypothetical protein